MAVPRPDSRLVALARQVISLTLLEAQQLQTIFAEMGFDFQCVPHQETTIGYVPISNKELQA